MRIMDNMVGSNLYYPAPSKHLNITNKKYSHNMRSYISHNMRHIDHMCEYAPKQYKGNISDMPYMMHIMNNRFFLYRYENPAPFDSIITMEKK
jgi:hypothetical protein